MTHLTRLSSRFLVAVATMAIAAVSLAPSPVSAQALYGSIVGTVADESGAPVPGVTVSATNTGTGLKIDAVTDGNGRASCRERVWIPV